MHFYTDDKFDVVNNELLRRKLVKDNDINFQTGLIFTNLKLVLRFSV